MYIAKRGRLCFTLARFGIILVLITFFLCASSKALTPRVGGIAGGYCHQVGVYVPFIHKLVWVFVFGTVVLGLGFFLSTIVTVIDSILLIFICNAQHL